MTSKRKLPFFRYHFIALATIFFVFGGLTAWSVLGPFEGAVFASGTISVQSEHKSIQHLEGGIISKLYAKEGQLVSKNDVLIRLDDTVIKTELSRLNVQLTKLLAQEARLIAERDESDISTLPSNINSLIGTKSIENQHSLYSARKAAQNTSIDISTQQILHMRKKIEGLEAKVASETKQVQLMEEELSGLTKLTNKGLSPRPKLLALKRSKTALEGNIQSTLSEISATKVRIAEAQLKATESKETFLENVLLELSDVQTNLAKTEENIARAQDQLSRLDIRSPETGTVFGIKIHTEGGVVSAGSELMYIVPQNDKLIIKAKVPPPNIDRVYISQTVRLKFGAFRQQDISDPIGIVKKISADTINDKRTGFPQYEVVIEMSSQTPLGPEIQIVPGMPVETVFKTDDRNALSYLTGPFIDALNHSFRE